MALKHAILAALSRGKPRTGYELNTSFNDVNDRAWHASPSQVYAELTKLEKAGLIDISTRDKRGKTSYIINDTGLDELRRWLVHDEPDHGIRDDAMLRLVTLWVLDETTSGFLLDAEIAHQRKRQISLYRLHQNWDQERDEPNSPVWRNRHALYLLWLKQTEVTLDWLERLRVVLSEPDTDVSQILADYAPPPVPELGPSVT